MNTMNEESRRKEIAKDAIEIGMNDPYWLCNLHGKINHEDGERMVKELREDAELLKKAHQKIKDGEWLASEAALYIAEKANFGDYDTSDYLYDNIPIEVADKGNKNGDTK